MSRTWTVGAAFAWAALACAASVARAQDPAPAPADAPEAVEPGQGAADAPQPEDGAEQPAAPATDQEAGPTASDEGPTEEEPGPSDTRSTGAAGLDRAEEAPSSPAAQGNPGESFDGDDGRLRYVLERIEVRGNRRTRERVILRYVKLNAGDVLDVDDPELEMLRFRLLGTGFFQTVNLSLRKGSERGQVVLVIEVRERNTLVVSDLWMGLSADAEKSGPAQPLTAYAGADVAETNLGGTGITLGGAMGIAQNQLALRTRFFDPAFLGTHAMISAVLFYNDAREFYGNRDVLYDDPENAAVKREDFAVVRYRRFGGMLGVGRDLSMPLQLWLDYRLERVDATLPLAASHKRGLDREPLEFGLNRGLSMLSTVRATLRYDTRDSPILPTRGWHTSVAAEVALAPFGSDYPYEKVTLNASRWFELPWRHVVRAGFFGGAISGYAPIYERFYVGDFSDFLPSRMLDLNTDRRPAPNFLGTDIEEIRYGNYAAKVLGEYRIPLYRGHRSVYGIDLFGAAGIYGVASHRDLTDPPRGYSGLARVPVDLTFNLGLQVDTNVGGFTFAFSSVLGFIPVRGEGE